MADNSPYQHQQEVEGVVSNGMAGDSMSAQELPQPSQHDQQLTPAVTQDFQQKQTSSISSPGGSNNSMQADVAVTVDTVVITSIYEVRSALHRWCILFGVALAALLVPLTDTIYLPALPSVGRDLNASQSAVAATVSVYLFTVGTGNLIWGPFSDRYGRRLTYMLTTIAYIGTTVGCIFSPNIATLIAMRALQGFAQCAFLTTGQAVVADVFAPAVRGTAVGMFMISVLIGPVIAPLIGGALSDAFGWRSTFVLLVIFCGVLGVFLFFFLPETQQYTVLTQLIEKDKIHGESIVEAQQILAVKPVFTRPWMVLKFWYDPNTAPYILLNTWTCAALFSTLTEWPIYMAESPYNLSQSIIGVTYMSFGFGALLGSPLGGKAADRSAAKYPDVVQSRMLYNLCASAIFLPFGILFYGWGLHDKIHIAALLVAIFFIGFGYSTFSPGVYSYVSCVEQANAGAATAALNSAWCIMSGVLVLVSVPGVNSLGVGWYFTMLVCIHYSLVITVGICIAAKFRNSNRRRVLPA